jgi:carbamoyltransferase
MIVLGLNAYHGDASACLLRDGRIIAAAEEERFRRIKHWAGFPSEAIRYCLAEAGIGLAEVDHVAVNSDPKANLLKKAGYALKKRPELALVLQRLRNQSERASVADELARAFPGQRFDGTVHQVEHHLAHLASCFYVSPFEDAVALSVDGFGDFASSAWGFGSGTRLEVDDRVYFPHSLGIFYQALTQYLGFPNYGDEYKVMGLAPYGQPTYLKQMREIVQLEPDGGFRLTLDYFRHHKERIEYEWSSGSPEVGTLFSPALEALLGPARAKDAPLEAHHRDIAHSVQAMYEEAFFHLLERLHARYGSNRLTLAGGCGMNSVANGKVYRRSPFRRLYVQSAAGDAGGAIGAALVAAREQGDGGRPERMEHAFWGPSFSDASIGALLATRSAELAEAGCVLERVPELPALCERTAAAVADGQVVGWFQGRMEWGPRALGNRSIVCDPRRADMKEILNRKIKRRESFRPFAPSILREQTADWFEEDDDVPFMMKVFQIREERRAQIPAVTHVDGSGRLQTVYRETNPRYYQLIEAFQRLTGVPMVLNTSFNENEPVVCRPEEALDCFLRTKMDVLVLGDYFVAREGRSSAA